MAVNCLKCGREISDDEVFCQDCLLDAQRYPVDPSAAVYLPHRKAAETVKKQPRRRMVPMEEQLKVLRRRCRNLTIALVLVIALLLAMAYPAVAYLLTDHYRPGQNYTPMTTIPPATTSVE